MSFAETAQRTASLTVAEVRAKLLDGPVSRHTFIDIETGLARLRPLPSPRIKFPRPDCGSIAAWQ
jgi:hypothetical protein